METDKSENPGGITDTTQVSGGSYEKDGYVKLETYKRTVAQEKNLRSRLEETESRLNELLTKEEQLKEAKLKEEKRFQELAEEKDRQLKEVLNEKELYRKSLLDAHKLNAFKEKLPGAIANPAYYSLVDIEEIRMDESGNIDQDSLTGLVNSFLENHSRLLDVKQGKNPPSNAPGTPQPSLSIEEWQKLPLMEKKKRMGEVYKNFTK